MAFLIVPAALLVLALLAVPMLGMANIATRTFDSAQGMIQAFTLDNFVRAVADPFYRKVLFTTIAVAAISTLLTLLLAFAPAYWLARTQSKHKSLFTILTLFPLLIGGVIRAAGWMALLGNAGLINAALLWTGWIDAPVKLIYTPGAVVAGLVGVVLPYMVLTLASVIESVRRDTEEAAANLGAPPFVVFRRIVLPQTMPGIIAGCTLVFILCMNAYSTPVLLGGPQFQMIAPAVYDQFSRANNWPFGAALAFVMLAATIVLTVTGSALLARRYSKRNSV